MNQRAIVPRQILGPIDSIKLFYFKDKLFLTARLPDPADQSRMVYCNLAAGDHKFVWLVNDRVNPKGEYYYIDESLDDKEKEDEAHAYFKNYNVKDICDDDQGTWFQREDGFLVFYSST